MDLPNWLKWVIPFGLNGLTNSLYAWWLFMLCRRLLTFSKCSFRNTIRLSNSWEPDPKCRSWSGSKLFAKVQQMANFAASKEKVGEATNFMMSSAANYIALYWLILFFFYIFASKHQELDSKHSLRTQSIYCKKLWRHQNKTCCLLISPRELTCWNMPSLYQCHMPEKINSHPIHKTGTDPMASIAKRFVLSRKLLQWHTKMGINRA